MLTGAAAAARERTGGTLPPFEQRLHEETAALIEFAGEQNAWTEGAKITLESAVELAYNETGDPAAD